jgi:transcriptional regulator of acetoin/glycerol metabolism
MEMCDAVNEDFAISQAAQGAKTKKYVVPKFGTKTPARPTGSIKKGAVRNSTSFLNQHRPKRSQAKISVKRAKKVITKMEVIRPSLPRKKSNLKVHQKALMDADVDAEVPKAEVTTKQEQERILSKKSLLQNRTLLLSNTDPHDSNLQCHEESVSIRYSRRMPVFPPVSSSHANAQPVTSNQCRVSLVGEGGGKRAKFIRPAARQSVEGKNLLIPPKLSIVSLKLPNIM